MMQYLLHALAFFACASPIAAADTVQLSSAGGTIEVTGKIIDYTGQKITIERAGGREQTYASRRVLQVDTTWPEGYQAGQNALATHDYRRAIEQFTTAARSDQRPWVRRLAMTGLMRAYASVGEWTTAGDLLVALAKSDPATPALDEAPLAWHAVEGVPRGKVETWMADDTSPTTRLLGTSHALSTSKRTEALQLLRELEAADDERITFLARAQSWRAEIVTAKRSDVDRWEKLTREAPEPLQAGAWFVIGEAHRQQRQHDAAAIAYLRLPVLYPEQHLLAARSLWEAAQVTRAAGREEESEAIVRELIRDYGKTPPARQARAVLQSLEKGR